MQSFLQWILLQLALAMHNKLFTLSYHGGAGMDYITIPEKKSRHEERRSWLKTKGAHELTRLQNDDL